ncbi:MAG TPA: hypothetical protein VMF52_08940 [Steroidobacteraceae bacterium]|nr:hypothetical protein [Steroidobacteraceae bacterium]
MRASLVSALLVAGLTSGVAQADYWCPPGREETVRANGECLLAATQAQVAEFKTRWFAAAREEAGRLDVPYEDIVVALFASWKRRGSFCLSVFDSPPTAEVVRRLRTLGFKPTSCSIWHHVDYNHVYRIRQTGENTFVVNYGNYSGPLAAGEWEITVTRNPDGTFTTKEDLIWIS